AEGHDDVGGDRGDRENFDDQRKRVEWPLARRRRARRVLLHGKALGDGGVHGRRSSGSENLRSIATSRRRKRQTPSRRRSSASYSPGERSSVVPRSVRKSSR